ncbi:hypothetical protein BAC3_00598 [uncultured bacterium]|nr:hypothetical protein BAC3_00598 [uncultured bacterium]
MRSLAKSYDGESYRIIELVISTLKGRGTRLVFRFYRNTFLYALERNEVTGAECIVDSS